MLKSNQRLKHYTITALCVGKHPDLSTLGAKTHQPVTQLHTTHQPKTQDHTAHRPITQQYTTHQPMTQQHTAH